MVALAIMALVATIAFSGLRIGLSSWERGTRAVDTMDRRVTIERLLKRQLALAHPSQFKINDQTSIFFRGTEQRLEFVSDYSLADGATEFRKLDYAAENGRFLYRERPLFDYVPAENEEPPSETIATFRRVAFRYLGRGADDAAVWVNEWKIGMGLPVAVLAEIDDDRFVIRLVNR